MLTGKGWGYDVDGASTWFHKLWAHSGVQILDINKLRKKQTPPMQVY
jgi:hypothetical protein